MANEMANEATTGAAASAQEILTWLDDFRPPHPYADRVAAAQALTTLAVGYGSMPVGEGYYAPYVESMAVLDGEAVPVVYTDGLLSEIFSDEESAWFIAERAVKRIIDLHRGMKSLSGDDWYTKVKYTPDIVTAKRATLARMESRQAMGEAGPEDVPVADAAEPPAAAPADGIGVTIYFGVMVDMVTSPDGLPKKVYYAYLAQETRRADGTTIVERIPMPDRQYSTGGAAGLTASNAAKKIAAALEENARASGITATVQLVRLEKSVSIVDALPFPTSTTTEEAPSKPATEVSGAVPANGVPPGEKPATGAPAAPAPGINAKGDPVIPADIDPALMQYVLPPQVKPEELLGQDHNLRVARAAIRKNDPVRIEGHTGCGKTLLAQVIAYEDGMPFARLNLNGQTGVDEFVGRYLIKDGTTYWVDGILTMAMRYGWYLLLDEINAALPEINFVLQTVLDDARYLRLAEKDGEVVQPHPNFRVFAAMNPSDEYAGTKELNHSLASRFKATIVMDYPAPTIEQRILVERTGVSQGDAATMVEFATRARNGKKAGSCFVPVGTRDLLAWAEYTVALKDRNTAFQCTILNKAGSDAKFFSDQFANADKMWKEFAARHGKADVVTLIQDAESKLKAVETAREDAERLINTASLRCVEMLQEGEAKKAALNKELEELEKQRQAAVEEQGERIMKDVLALVGSTLGKDGATGGVAAALAGAIANGASS